MISRVFTLGFATCFSVIFFCGCNQFLKGKPQPPKIIEIKTSELECVKEVPSDFKKLVDSKATEQDIDRTFACINKTLEQFQTRAEGRAKPDAFNGQELFIIFETFFKNAAISQTAAENLLILKKALLGGAESEITKHELDLLKEYLKVVQVEVKNLSPYLKIFTFKKENGPFEEKTLNRAFSQLRHSLKTLLAASKFTHAEYKFEDVKQLTVSLNIVKDQQDQETLLLLENVLNLVSGVDPLKSESEYQHTIESIVDLASLYANALYTDLKFEIAEKNQFNKVLDFVWRVIETLENSVQYTKHKNIPVKHLDPIIKEVLKSKIIPVEVREETFMAFYRKIIIRVFNDEKNLDHTSLESLKPIVFKNIKREFFIYKLYQDMINSIDFGVKTFITPQVLSAKIKAYNFQDALARTPQKLDTQTLKEITLGLEEIRQEALTRMPILYRDKKYILATSQNTAEVDWEDVSRAHYVKTLGRALIVGWGVLDPQMSMMKSKVYESGFNKWYLDFRDFALEIKLFDPRTKDNGSNNFTQANLFTYSGNGDDSLSYFEVLQFVNMLLSGGGELTTEIQKTMIDAGCAMNELDLFGNPWLDEKCFIKNLKANTKKHFTNLYLYSKYVEGLNDQEFMAFYNDMMSVARNNPAMKGRIETDDIRTYALLSMFIESLFAVYDTKAPFGQVTADEIRSAYPRFTGFVADYTSKPDVAEKLKGWDAWYNYCKIWYTQTEFLREAFVFLVYTGHAPAQSDVNLACKESLFTFEGGVNRRKIISTFQILKTEIASGNANSN